jgi:hypothetical protein
MYEIARRDLRPGDAIGHCGPTTAGNGGHIALWLGKAGSLEHILDMPGGTGPIDHTTTWGAAGNGWNAAGNLKAYRFRGVIESAGSVPPKGEPDMFLAKTEKDAAVYLSNGWQWTHVQPPEFPYLQKVLPFVVVPDAKTLMATIGTERGTADANHVTGTEARDIARTEIDRANVTPG